MADTVTPQLKKCEREVLFPVASGHTDRHVAETLVLNRRTVNRRMSNIFIE